MTIPTLIDRFVELQNSSMETGGMKFPVGQSRPYSSHENWIGIKHHNLVLHPKFA